MKKIISFILALTLLFSIGITALADGDNAPNQSRAVIGADLTPEQVSSVYQLFGVTRGGPIELTVTNAEEREYLEGYVDESPASMLSFCLKTPAWM